MIDKQKQQIRAKKKAQRKNLGKEEVDIRSRQIVYAFLEEFLVDGKRILTYLPQVDSNEVDTWHLVEELFYLKKTEIYVPVFDSDTNSIVPTKINDNTVFYNDKFKIPIPKNNYIEDKNGSTESDIEFDYIVIPLVAFDLNGQRLGHGNGSYDRFLKTQPNGTVKIGFAYEIQLNEKPIPADENDVKLDYCITEERVLKFL